MRRQKGPGPVRRWNQARREMLVGRKALRVWVVPHRCSESTATGGKLGWRIGCWRSPVCRRLKTAHPDEAMHRMHLGDVVIAIGAGIIIGTLHAFLSTGRQQNTAISGKRTYLANAIYAFAANATQGLGQSTRAMHRMPLGMTTWTTGCVPSEVVTA